MKKIYIGILLLTSILACSTKEKYVPQLTFYNDNVLLPTITFTTETSNEVYLKYWLFDGETNVHKSRISTGNNHSITLTNIKPNTRYKYVIHNVETDQDSEVFYFTTSILPSDMLQVKKTLIDTTKFNGYILLRKISTSSADVIIDNENFKNIDFSDSRIIGFDFVNCPDNVKISHSILPFTNWRFLITHGTHS